MQAGITHTPLLSLWIEGQTSLKERDAPGPWKVPPWVHTMIKTVKPPTAELLTSNESAGIVRDGGLSSSDFFGQLTAPRESSHNKQALNGTELSVEERSAIANERVRTITRLLLAELGIDTSRVQFPTVRVDTEKNTSCYHPFKNEINIHPGHLNSSTAYGEEIFHWLREQLKPTAEKSKLPHPDLPDREFFAVEEFFGFVGRSIVGEICESAKLDSIINDSKVHTFANGLSAKETYRKVSDDLMVLAHHTAKIIRNITVHLDALQAIDSTDGARACADIQLRVLTAQAVVEDWQRALDSSTAPAAGLRAQKKLLTLTSRFCARCLQEFQPPTDTLAPEAPAVSASAITAKIPTWQGVAAAVTRELQGLLNSIDKASLLNEEQKLSSERHDPGYAAGFRFLAREQNVKATITHLLTKPSITIYFSHIFQIPESPNTGGLLGRLLTPITAPWARYRERQRMKEEVQFEKYALGLGIPPGVKGREDREALRRVLSQSAESLTSE